MSVNLRSSQKREEAALPESEQHEALLQHVKFTPHHGPLATDARLLDEKLKDPLVHKIHNLLEKGDHTKCFLSLYRAALEGKLDNSETFTDICAVFEDRLRRTQSDNKNLIYATRYRQNYLNFMILMRSRGGQSARQYSILTSQLGGPTGRHLRWVCYHNQSTSVLDADTI